MPNKKAQVGEIVTWITATVIIILILILFIYASSIFAQKTKIVGVKNIKTEIKKETNWLEMKTDFAYQLASQEDKLIIEEWRETHE